MSLNNRDGVVNILPIRVSYYEFAAYSRLLTFGHIFRPFFILAFRRGFLSPFVEHISRRAIRSSGTLLLHGF